jgi:hypothetical protein
MKNIISVIILVHLSFLTFSQVATDKLFYEQKVIKYTKMKQTGTFLTVAGGVLTTIGIVVWANSSISTHEDGYGNVETTTEGNPELGTAALLLGMGGSWDRGFHCGLLKPIRKR